MNQYKLLITSMSFADMFNAQERIGKQSVKEILVDLKKEDMLRHIDGHGDLKYKFEEMDPFPDKLKWILKKNRIGYIERIERIFTLGELKMCPLLKVGIARAPKGTGGPEYGTSYDMREACPYCGSGANQIGSLMMMKSEIPKDKDAFGTYDGEIIVSKRVMEALSQKNFKGLELRQIMGSGTPMDYYQIIASHTLKQMSKDTSGMPIDKQCDKCHRDGHFCEPDIPLDIHYDNIDSKSLDQSDVFFTHECFGYSTYSEYIQTKSALGENIEKPDVYVGYQRHFTVKVDSHELEKRIGFSHPLLLVKPEIMLVLKEIKAKGFYFEPVIVNGYPDLESWKKPLRK